jgi:hypothetical protein
VKRAGVLLARRFAQRGKSCGCFCRYHCPSSFSFLPTQAAACLWYPIDEINFTVRADKDDLTLLQLTFSRQLIGNALTQLDAETFAGLSKLSFL